jgi:protein TonB
MVVLRLGLSLFMGTFITLGLFFVMQALIQSGRSVLSEGGANTIIDFVRLKHEQVLETKKRKPEKPPPPDEPPPEIRPQLSNVAVDKAGFTMASVDVDVTIDVRGGGFGISDGEYLPIVKVQPIYPRRALSRGMSGWVMLEYTVTAQGTVRDPSVVANCAMVTSFGREVECSDRPSNVFDIAAMKAALKFKYKPKVIDGLPVDTAGVLHKITFELVDE